MSRLLRPLLLSVAAVAAIGCGGAKKAPAMPDSAPLAIPPAPARVVVPAAPDDMPAVPDVAPPLAAAPSGASRTGRDAPPAKPPVAPTAPPAAPPAQPPTAAPAPSTLETPGNFEQRARRLKASAEELLKTIDYGTLSADGKAQYDSAKRFLDQAESALKAKNVLYAWQLADKANTIATLLRR